jgi:hypothetical protein
LICRHIALACKIKLVNNIGSAPPVPDDSSVVNVDSLPMSRSVLSVLSSVLKLHQATTIYCYMFTYYGLVLFCIMLFVYVCTCYVLEFVHRDIIMKITNKMQLYRLIYYS